MSANTPEIDRDRIKLLAEHFHAEAEECRRMAKSASSPSVEAEWLRLAESWTRLARSAEA